MTEKEIPVASVHELQRLQWKRYYLFAKPCVYYASIYLVGGLSPHLHEELKLFDLEENDIIEFIFVDRTLRLA